MLSGFISWLRGLSRQRVPASPGLTRAQEAAEAKRLYRRAAKGDVEARRLLGRAYVEGRGVPRSRSEGVRWLSRAAEAGDAEARLLLAYLHLQGLGHAEAAGLFDHPGPLQADPAAAAVQARAAAEGGSAPAMALYAWLCATGQGVEQDIQAAARWYAQAAEMGNPSAKLGLGMIRLHGMDGVVDAPMACRLISEAAEAKLPMALYVLGTLYEAAVPPLPFDEERAFKLYEEAAAQDVRPACARLGMALLQGWGCQRNPVQAERWLRRAAMAGDREAAAVVGDMNAYPVDGTPPNEMEAMKWYRLAADLGHVTAMRILGLALRQGRGVPRNDEEATRWLDKAAAAGDAEAAADLARMGSASGNDTQDAREAADRLEALAANGDLLSAFNYAVCLHLGVGRVKDPAGALHWMRVASEGGQLNARYWYGRLLLEGGGDAEEGWRAIASAAEEGVPEARAAMRARAAA